MDKLEGHVLQPLTPWLRKQGLVMPNAWDGKSRCKPDIGIQEKKVNKTFEEVYDRIPWKNFEKEAKEKRRGKNAFRNYMKVLGAKPLNVVKRGMKIGELWDNWEKANGESVAEEDLNKCNDIPNEYVVCPIDKFPQYGCIV